MKVSIVLPVWNGEESVGESLDALANLKYPPEDVEVIAVDDGSRDRTWEIMQEKKRLFKKRGIAYSPNRFEKNRGRIKARVFGAMKAKYNMLLFIDHRGIVNLDMLSCMKEKNYEPIIGSLDQDPDRNLVSRFFFVLRRFVYRPHWGVDFEDMYIDKKNFDSTPKGFCPFLCDRDRLLRNIPKKTGGNVNDDTRIFKGIIKEKRILRTSDCKIEYLERADFKDMSQHIFHRGPRFVEYYMGSGSKYESIVYTVLSLPLICVVGCVLACVYPLYMLAGVTVTLGVIVCAMVRSPKDLLALLTVGPYMILLFTAGVYKGLFLKIMSKKK